MINYLATYAANPLETIGRHFAEPASETRNAFQRDRDRIIHSTAFRRLEYKTQVFVNHEGDLFRTRLTHSLEVAQMARGIARTLNLHEDLTEAIALAHDLGHTPFGHAGQDALNDCMREYGGFEHNLQSLRVVEKLEQRYADFDGLNLTFEVREGILKHCSIKNAKLLGDVGQRFLAKSSHETVRRMINTLVVDLCTQSTLNIEQHKPNNLNEIRQLPQLLGFSSHVAEQNQKLKQFLRKNLYHHYKVNRMSAKAARIVRELFEAFFKNTGLLPSEFQVSAEID